MLISTMPRKKFAQSEVHDWGKNLPKIPKEPLETASTLIVTPYLPLLGQQY